MADDEIMIEDDAIALEDTDDTSSCRRDVSNIIPFHYGAISAALKTIAIKTKNGGFAHIVTIVVCTAQMYSLRNQKSLVSLSK